jgi:hypothetical protein
MSINRDDLRELLQQTGASIWPEPRRVADRIHREAERRKRRLPALPRLHLGFPAMAQLRVAAPVVLGGLIFAGPVLIALTGGHNKPEAVRTMVRPPVRQTDNPQVVNPQVPTVQGPTSPVGTPGGGPSVAPNRPVAVAPSAPAAPPVARPTPRGPCTPADLKITATTNQTTYSASQLVQIQLIAVNTSTVDCPVDTGNCANEARVYDSAGSLVWSSTSDRTNLCPPTGSGYQLVPPGQSAAVSFSWDQQDCRGGVSGTQCTGTLAPGGHYQVGGILVAADSAISARRGGFDLNARPV